MKMSEVLILGGLAAGVFFTEPETREARRPSTGTEAASVDAVETETRTEATPDPTEEPSLEEIVRWIDWSALHGRMQVVRTKVDAEEREAVLLVQFTRRSDYVLDLLGRYALFGFNEDSVLVLRGGEIYFGPPKLVYEVGDRCYAHLRIPDWSFLAPCTTLQIQKKP